MRQVFLWASRQQWLGTQFRKRRFAQVAVRRFMPGEDVESALNAAMAFRDRMSTVVTQLGENITQLSEARAVSDHYLSVLDQVAQRGLDGHISVKLTQLGLDVSAAETERLMQGLLRRAAELKNVIWIDMEDSSYVDRTLDLYRRLRGDHANVGVCLQSYLRRTPRDLESLLPLGSSIRLVKGAYREPASVAFPVKRDVDEAFFQLAQTLLSVAGKNGSRVGFGTHDMNLVERIRAAARSKGIADRAFEVQMLYGIGQQHQDRLAREGAAVRVLISYGSHWFPWYMRRLAERPANVWFVVKSMFS